MGKIETLLATGLVAVSVTACASGGLDAPQEVAVA